MADDELQKKEIDDARYLCEAVGSQRRADRDKVRIVDENLGLIESSVQAAWTINQYYGLVGTQAVTWRDLVPPLAA